MTGTLNSPSTPNPPTAPSNGPKLITLFTQLVGPDSEHLYLKIKALEANEALAGHLFGPNLAGDDGIFTSQLRDATTLFLDSNSLYLTKNPANEIIESDHSDFPKRALAIPTLDEGMLAVMASQKGLVMKSSGNPVFANTGRISWPSFLCAIREANYSKKMPADYDFLITETSRMELAKSFRAGRSAQQTWDDYVGAIEFNQREVESSQVSTNFRQPLTPSSKFAPEAIKDTLLAWADGAVLLTLAVLHASDPTLSKAGQGALFPAGPLTLPLKNAYQAIISAAGTIAGREGLIINTEVFQSWGYYHPDIHLKNHHLGKFFHQVQNYLDLPWKGDATKLGKAVNEFCFDSICFSGRGSINSAFDVHLVNKAVRKLASQKAPSAVVILSGDVGLINYLNTVTGCAILEGGRVVPGSLDPMQTELMLLWAEQREIQEKNMNARGLKPLRFSKSNQWTRQDWAELCRRTSALYQNLIPMLGHHFSKALTSEQAKGNPGLAAGTPLAEFSTVIQANISQALEDCRRFEHLMKTLLILSQKPLPTKSLAKAKRPR